VEQRVKPCSFTLMTPRTPPWRPIALAAGLALLALAAGACSSPTEPTPPTLAITCPADVAAVSNDGKAVVATYTTPTATGGSAPLTVACAPPSGSSFPPGSTSVTCTATDVQSRTATCGFAVKVSVPPRLALTKFMAFGDSMTSGKPGTVYAFGVEDYPGSYPTDLYTAFVARYTAQSFVMSKQGWPGEPTSVAVTRLQSTLPAVKPEVVLLMDGANDLSGGDPTAIAPAVANMRQMVVSSKTAGARVFLANLPPQVKGGSRAGGYALVPTYNVELAEVARETSVPLVDVYKALNTDPGSYIGPDGLHPTTAGYQKIADTFFPAIQAALEVTGTTPSAATVSPSSLGAWIVASPPTGAGPKPLATSAAAVDTTQRPQRRRDR
jgi:lysophospholipase L1-like esterase